MQLPAYAEAVRFYHLALQALERQEPVDEAQRCTLLLALGEAQRKAGEHLEAQETFLRAADIARALGATESFVRAALELERLTHAGRSFRRPSGAPARGSAASTRGGRQSPQGENPGRFGPSTAGHRRSSRQALVYAQQAVAMARRLADPELLAANLEGMIYALQGPEHAQQRLAYATEMLQLAKAANAKQLLLDAHFWRVYCLLELGDMPATDAEIDAYAHLAEELQQPFDLCLATGFRAMRALMQGRFADSERLAQEALAIGQRLQTENAAGIFGLQMFTLRREQGRLKELEPVVRYFVQQHTVAGAWRPAWR